MHSKQIRELMRSPKAQIQHQLTGLPPRLITPDSPLIRLLEQCSVRQRIAIRGVTISPDLGYSSGPRFDNAEQLYRWLKPSAQMLESETWPAEARRIKIFSRHLTEHDLKKACTSWF